MEPAVDHNNSTTLSKRAKQRRRQSKKGNNALPEAPQHSTVYNIAAQTQPSKPMASNRNQRRADYENSKEVQAYYAAKERSARVAAAIKKIVADPKKGLYLASDPSVRYAECARCSTRFEILKGSPLLVADVQIDRDDESGAWWMLEPDNECPKCSYSNASLGWCVIVDTIDSSDEEETKSTSKHDLSIKQGKISGSQLAKEYALNPRVFEHGYRDCRNMCLCSGCIRAFELGKYDYKLAQGRNIQRYLRDPESERLVKPTFVSRGVEYRY